MTMELKECPTLTPEPIDLTTMMPGDIVFGQPSVEDGTVDEQLQDIDSIPSDVATRCRLPLVILSSANGGELFYLPLFFEGSMIDEDDDTMRRRFCCVWPVGDRMFFGSTSDAMARAITDSRRGFNETAKLECAYRNIILPLMEGKK